MKFIKDTTDVEREEIVQGIAGAGLVAGVTMLATMFAVRKQSFTAFAVKSFVAGLLAAGGYVAAIIGFVAVVVKEDVG